MNCAGKMSHNEHIFKNELFLFSVLHNSVVCVCVCVCVCERERVYVSGVSVWVRERVCVYVSWCV